MSCAWADISAVVFDSKKLFVAICSKAMLLFHAEGRRGEGTVFTALYLCVCLLAQWLKNRFNYQFIEQNDRSATYTDMHEIHVSLE